MSAYEEMMTSDDKVDEWVKKGQNHDDVILEWSLTCQMMSSLNGEVITVNGVELTECFFR